MSMSIGVTFIVTFVLTAIIMLGFAHLSGMKSNYIAHKTENDGKDSETDSKRSKNNIIAVVESKPLGCITCKNN